MQSEGNSYIQVTGTISFMQNIYGDHESCSLNQNALIRGNVVCNDKSMCGIQRKILTRLQVTGTKYNFAIPQPIP